MTGFTIFVIEIRGNVAQLLGRWIEYNYYTISIKDTILNKSCSSYKVRNSKFLVFITEIRGDVAQLVIGWMECGVHLNV